MFVMCLRRGMFKPGTKLPSYTYCRQLIYSPNPDLNQAL